MSSDPVKSLNLSPDEQDERSVSGLTPRNLNAPSHLSREPSPSSSPSLHPLQFITLTERPASQKNDYSYTVRSHAMQSFLREKKNANREPLKLSSASAKKHDQQTPKQLSGKFKLATWSRKPRTKKAKSTISRETSAESVSVKDEDVHGENSFSPLGNHGDTPPHLIDANMLELLCYYMAPFALGMLCTSTKDMPSPNSNITLDPSTTADPALLNATMCFESQIQDLGKGAHDSQETLLYKGEARRLMIPRLGPSHRISDADIMAVAILVIVESLNGTFEEASLHRTGLSKMVKLQGNIGHFEDNDTVSCILIWSDIVFSTRFPLPAKFSYLSGPIPSQLDPHLSDPYATVFSDSNTITILHNLRSISSTIDLLTLSPTDRKSLTYIVYQTQYHLLNSVQLSNFQSLSPRTQTVDYPHMWDSPKEINLRNQSPAQILTTGFYIASLLFLQTRIHRPTHSVLLHKRLFSHLLVLMRHHAKQLLKFRNFPDTEPALSSQLLAFTEQEFDIILWVLVTAIAATNDIDNKRGFTGLLRDHISDCNLSLEQAEVRVRDVVWRGGIDLNMEELKFKNSLVQRRGIWELSKDLGLTPSKAMKK